MKPLLTLLIFSSVTFSSSVAKADQYLCISEASAGIFFSETVNDWRGTPFKSGHKYIVAPPPEDHYAAGNAAFLITELGSENPIFVCKEGFSKKGEMNCRLFQSSAHFPGVTVEFH